MLGAGGHAGVLIELLRQNGRDIKGIVAPTIEPSRPVLRGLSHFVADDDVLNFDPAEVELVNGIGSLPGSALRGSVYRKFATLGYHFSTVISQSAVVSDYVALGEGVQILPGAIVQCGASIGDNTIINSGAIVEHDCRIGEHNHLAPGVTLSGNVRTGNSVHLGTGAVVIQGVAIGADAVVGAGATLTRDVPAGATILGFRAITKTG